MNDETAKALIEALNRFSAALEKMQAGGLGGINVWHHGFPQTPLYHQSPYQTPYQPQFQPWITCGSTGGNQ